MKEQEKKKRRKRDEEDLETHQRIDDYEGMTRIVEQQRSEIRS